MSAYIEDFGEKIGGARKDMWSGRGLNKEDLMQINYREYTDTITKNNIWPVPKWADYLQKGMEPACIYFMKQVRDAIPSKLNVTGKEERDRFTAECFITFVREFKEHLETILTIDDIHKHLSRFLEKYGYMEGTRYTTKSSPIWFLDHKFTNRVVYDSSEIKKLVNETIIQNFPHSFLGELKGAEFSRDYRTRDIGLYKKYTRLYPKLSFTTVEEAMEFAAGGGVIKHIEEAKANGTYETKKRENKTFTLVRPQLRHISRTGPEFRPRNRNITPDEMIKYFGFRAGEFGLWNNQDDRQACLNYAFDALVDLAYVVGSSTQFISLGGYQDKKLAIAFGARGKGKALAHYEPSRVVINLTKMKGAGALAHEWMHALDDAIGYKCGTKGTDNNFISAISYSKTDYKYPKVVEAALALSQAITRREQTDAEVLESSNREIQRANNNIESWYSRTHRSIKEALTSLEETENSQDRQKYDRLSSKYQALYAKFSVTYGKDEFEKICEIYKELIGRLPSKDTRDAIEQNIRYKSAYTAQIDEYKQNGTLSRKYKTKSDFYKNAQELDKGKPKPYYTEPWEMWARAFETYVQTKLPFKSQYLVHSAKNHSLYGDYKPYPEGEDLVRITEAMDKFIAICVDTFGERKELPKYQNLSKQAEEDDVYATQLYDDNGDDDEVYTPDEADEEEELAFEDTEDADEGYEPYIETEVETDPEPKLNLNPDKTPADFLIQIYTGLEKSDHIKGAIKQTIDKILGGIGRATMLSQEEFTKDLPEAQIQLLVEKFDYYVVNKNKQQLGQVSGAITDVLEDLENILVVKTRTIYFNSSSDKSADITEQDKISLLTQRKLLQAETQNAKPDFQQQVMAAISAQTTAIKNKVPPPVEPEETAVKAGTATKSEETKQDKVQIESAKDLREHLAVEARKLIPNNCLPNRKYQYDVLVRRVTQLKLGKVVEGSVPYNKALGISKGWRVEAGQLIISSSATEEKKVESAIEAVSKLLMRLEIQDKEQQELFLESTVYMVCKKLDIDVRSYMQSDKFEQLTQNKVILTQFIDKSKEIYTKLFSALGLKYVLK